MFIVLAEFREAQTSLVAKYLFQIMLCDSIYQENCQ